MCCRVGYFVLFKQGLVIEHRLLQAFHLPSCGGCPSEYWDYRCAPPFQCTGNFSRKQ